MSNKIFSAKNFIIQKMEHFPNGVSPTPEDVENWIEEYSKEYATECIKASLEKASENAKIEKEYSIKYQDFIPDGIDKESITNPENIVLL